MITKIKARLLDLLPRSPRAMLVAEFSDAEALIAAAGRLREDGYVRFDAHSPWPIEGIGKVMQLRESPLPYIVLGAGLSTFLGFMGFMAWASLDYPAIHSGKPVLSPWPLIPAAIEVTWIVAGTAALVGFILLAGLPLYYHLVFKSARFKRASDDGFMITVDGDDARFDETRTRELLTSLGGQVELLKEEQDAPKGKGHP